MANIIATKAKRNPKKTIIVVVAIIIAVAALGFGFSRTPVGSDFFNSIATMLKGGDSDDNKSPGNGQPEPSPKDVNKLYSQATKEVENGNTQQAVTAYEDAISAKEGNADKAGLYLELSASLLNYGKSDADKQKALDYALKAEELDPSMAAAAQLALVYRSRNDTAEATKYEALVRDRDTSEWKDR